MTILRQQTNYNSSEEFGELYEASLNQSLYFDRPFTLDSVTVRFDSTTADTVMDLEVRCEVRSAVGPDDQIDIRVDPIDVSAWYNDHDIPPGEFTFTMNSLPFQAGFYWFSFVVNVTYGFPFLLATQKLASGTFLGKFIRIRNNTGIYLQDKSLRIISEGTWNEPQGRTVVAFHGETASISIQDRG